MKLQQLRYALEVYRHNLNVSEAADALFTSQPGISKQIRLLEEELGIQIFIRSGKRVVSVSQPGKAVLEISERILRDVQNIKNIGSEFTDHDSGALTIATTHTQARYALPHIVADFVKRYPRVNLTIKQGSPSAIAQMVSNGEADIAIITEKLDDHPELRKLNCYDWNHAVIVPKNHPLLDCRNPLSIEDLASFPLITYEFAFHSSSSIARAFTKAKLEQPEVALAAADTDVLKTYVKLGLGAGLMAKMAYDPQADQDLELIDVAHLFEPSPTWIAIRSDTYLRGYTYDFIEMFAPHLNRENIDRILYTPIMEDFSI
ncbi:CysB family HTH-type transcriptional regulator [Neisseria sp. CCUG17229]|uniref:CysB family HTH-type transcriptional regulator n=1 Tax=Neisseria brasiliensis TaxID=2666100 RepID=A0A5Q3S0Q5_9NEIS|nr:MULTISPECIES: CysB family HTH-type transcriptional regulator [Neisseria]MRN38655.1 CysB family HTH-type transcriptional regulator [Neisseria brasiliensis]PJO09349.1 CysB family HTH-type transcriptional regulator [Neisseria sp. N95_16]PJO78720.1 CysB family HTH-type transcriptional regulator [Neisseria sp. N177_16]QGL25562.1 CysB family HTH-type transcriptional regulator [Neisseria brasiliensis]